MKRISTGSPFEARLGYSRAVVKGGWCFVSGVTGYDYSTMKMPVGASAQTERCLDTIGSVLSEAGFSIDDIVRVQYTIVDAALIDEIAPVLGARFATVRPAATMVIAGLIRPEMLIEIEVTAYRG